MAGNEKNEQNESKRPSRIKGPIGSDGSDGSNKSNGSNRSSEFIESSEKNRSNETSVVSKTKKKTINDESESTEIKEKKKITEKKISTSIKKDLEDEKEEEKKEKIIKEKEKEIESVDSCFNTLNMSIENLNSHINAILKDHEQKYVLIFNSYMHDVHKEIRVLKKIVKEEKIKELGNEKIKTLQKELHWYINECLELDKTCEILKKEVEKWKRSSTLMKDHMLFLEQRLTAALDKILKYETMKQSEPKEIKENNKEKDKEKEKEKDKDKDKGTIIKSKYLLKGKEENTSGEKKDETKGKENKELHLKIKTLEKKLKTQINVNSNLQNTLTKKYIEKSQYEKLFIECVQQIKNEIDKKKSDAEKEKYVEENFAPLIEQSEIPDFRKDDKKKLIKLFFSSNEIIHFVSKTIFNKEHISAQLNLNLNLNPTNNLNPNPVTNPNPDINRNFSFSLNSNQKLNFDNISRVNIPKKGKFTPFVL